MTNTDTVDNLTWTFRRGLDLPITGAASDVAPQQTDVRTVGLLGADYIGLKPRLQVEEGDEVAVGSAIFAHKDTPDVMVTSPVAGKVKAVNRGARRALISVEIQRTAGGKPPVDFSGIGDASTPDGLAERLAASGLWTSFRTRPYSKVPASDARPVAIFVTAMDTEPLSPDAAPIIAEQGEAFSAGLSAIKILSDGATYLCHEPGASIPCPDGITAATFSGPHPAGLPGTHIHHLHPPTSEAPVWTIWYQDVIAIGHLMQTGTLNPERMVALTGPLCTNPRMMRTIMGASLAELTEGELAGDAAPRVISGSVLSGRAAAGPGAFLGRYDRQVTLIEEDKEQIPMGWIRPMPGKYAFQPVLGSALSKKLYAFTSNLNGGRRAMVPTGTFEQLMPQDFLPTQLLRALLVMDTDTAQALGALELDEEDLGLVGFACPAKYEYGLALRDCLTKIEKEG